MHIVSPYCQNISNLQHCRKCEWHRMIFTPSGDMVQCSFFFSLAGVPSFMEDIISDAFFPMLQIVKQNSGSLPSTKQLLESLLNDRCAICLIVSLSCSSFVFQHQQHRHNMADQQQEMQKAMSKQHRQHLLARFLPL